jgi:hypothetical protein
MNYTEGSANCMTSTDNDIATILEEGAREAYSRPWFRLERGLRINRLRLYVNENFTGNAAKVQSELNLSEIEQVVSYLTKALDKKLLNTAKIVDYDTGKQRIVSIKGFEVRRQADGSIRSGFLKKRPETLKHTLSKSQASGTRRAKNTTVVVHEEGEHIAV